MLDDAKYAQLGRIFQESDTAKLKELIRYQPWVFQVTPEFNDQFLYAEEDCAPRYLEADSSVPLVHPGLMLNQSLVTRSPSFHLLAKAASVHSSDQLEWINPARVGKTFTVNWEFTDIYEKRGKLFSEITTTVTDDDHTLIMRRKIHGVVMQG